MNSIKEILAEEFATKEEWMNEHTEAFFKKIIKEVEEDVK